ncbi:hypothetical protein CJF42_02670 [Pseudoalteromonas sp. NBT06-2]|uniref:hypothetical protein n=1 Tax=Pseudoalteromonas sp. NBT06-2 TaxID=2025950 RepID=UPI000BA56BED|nr:hypothetical protein [Pseudoalteromonas sp. NBT06-2]PAJ75944.1 hypothetical protein CJF42_02670 [Pseudoalteromonas sp. NBT06-2]
MSVINMFRKEALRHQYKSQEFGHSVIKQPGIISKSIIGLCLIMLIGVICVQFITLTTNHTYNLQIAAENYQPLVMSKAVVITEQLVVEGENVNKNQPVANLNIIDDLGKLNNSHYLRASISGYYFQPQTDSTIIPAFKPIGYILKHTALNDFSFWLQQKPKNPVKVGDIVTLIIDEQLIEGRISMILGAFNERRGQKISVRLDNTNHLSLLSPKSKLKILLKQQPKTIAQLLR